ncbi:MAG TPA: alpha/beta fold hydrolase [Vicinamibacterales bacterium]|nr:alpha/beta fold hydrolase [Vicinamibacterales bacterium]
MESTSRFAAMTGHEAEQIERANDTGLQPVVFVHGLWLLSNSWQRWAELFEEAGYVALAPGWPDDPETTAEGRMHPEAFANKTIADIADHTEQIVLQLTRKPALIGHSFGGLMVQIIAGRGLSAATVAISPAPFRGVLPLPAAALESGWPILRNPANRHRAVALSFEQFQYGFANAVGEHEAQELFETYAVPGAGAPLFQAASANLNPWADAQVDTTNINRGPLLIVSADQDHTVPVTVANAAFQQQQNNIGVTEIVEMHDRGHALTIDNGWRDVADVSLAFVRRFV